MAEALDARLLSELLGLLAHDLRNPLSALHSNVGFLNSVLRDIDNDTREALSDTLVSCDGLASIIDNLELLSQSLIGARGGATAPVNLHPIVAQGVRRSEALAKSHGMRLALGEEQEGQLLVQSNREMLELAFGNLLRNAIQHGAPSAPVCVRIERRGPEAVVRVEDAGQPVDPDLSDEVFSAAGQVRCKGMSSGRYGRGLGLFCARVAAAAAGARVAAVASPSASGNVFELVVGLA